MSLTFSIFRGEVISSGTTIEIRAPSLVDAASAQTSVRLLQAGQQVTATVTVEGNVVKVSTQSLAPGSYRLAIGRLQGTSGQILSTPTVVAFVIGALIGSVPPELRVEHAVHLAIGDTSSERLRPGIKAPAGTRYVELVKTSHRETNAPVQLAFDDQGQKVDGDALISQVEQRRAAKFGRIHESLFNRLAKAGDGEIIDVAIWPRFPNLPKFAKPNDGEIKAAPAHEHVHLESVKLAKKNLIGTLRTTTTNRVALAEDQSDLPRVSASLTAAEIRKLAKSPDVGIVLLDEKQGIPSLTGSIAVSRTSAVHTLGYTGYAVRVAVFEEGPSDTTDLAYAGRYQDNPPAADHARFTSGIIKNVQANAPHGHAPDCNLYSANSWSNDALTWALSQGCTVVNQSFYRYGQELSSVLSSDDILKDWLTQKFPYPTIVHAAGNGDASKYVNHKGYNTISVGNHNDAPDGMSGDSLFRNPTSPHGDRELPELCANGTGVTSIGITASGTSAAAPAVSGVVALLQQIDTKLKTWPEGCRAILLASAGRNVSGSTWWDDVSAKNDSSDGAGALDANAAALITKQRKSKNDIASVRGFDIGQLTTADFGTDLYSSFKYSVLVPNETGCVAKIALAWSSKITTDAANAPTASNLTVNLDLIIKTNGTWVTSSASFDNSYEVVEFFAEPNTTYDIFIRRQTGTDDTYYGVAWTVFNAGTSLVE